MARGFTLVELMITLGVLAIIAALAAPSLSQFIAEQRLIAATNDLLYATRVTRSEAIKRGLRVSLCPRNLGTEPGCATNNAWQQGWLVFEDNNVNGSWDDGETLIQDQPGKPSSISITGNRNVSRYVSYSPLGDTRRARGAHRRGSLQLGTISICSSRLERGQAIIISRGGRAIRRAKACP